MDCQHIDKELSREAKCQYEIPRTEWTVGSTGAALIENNEASAKLTTANGGTFT